MNHWSLIYRFVWIALAVLLLAGMGFMFVPLIQQDREFQRREAQLTETIEQHEQEIRQLRIKQERFQTDPDFVERIAHDMGLIKPNEFIFRFVDEEHDEGTDRRQNED